MCYESSSAIRLITKIAPHNRESIRGAELSAPRGGEVSAPPKETQAICRIPAMKLAVSRYTSRHFRFCGELFSDQSTEVLNQRAEFDNQRATILANYAGMDVAVVQLTIVAGDTPQDVIDQIALQFPPDALMYMKYPVGPNSAPPL
jgi:hypothetical protein